MGNTPSGSAYHANASDESDPDYWRHKGDESAQERNRCFERSKAAYSRNDHAAAKKESAAGHAADRRSKQFQERAAQMYYQRNNAGRGPAEVDLHGLRVQEAVVYAERAMEAAKQQHKLKKMVLVVGRGNHSQDHIPKVKPAIMQLIEKHNLRCTPGIPNQGCIQVEFVSAHERGWFDWVSRALGCAIC